MSELRVVDTNILLQSVSILEDKNVIVPLAVLQELDNLKTSKDIGFEARRAIKAIRDYNPRIDLEFKLEEKKADDVILACAKNYNAELYTKDICLAEKAKAYSITTSNPLSDTDEVYTGYKEVHLSQSEMAALYQNPNCNYFELYNNQYLIVKDDSGYTVDKLRWNGEKYVGLKLPPSKVLKPLNDLQACALDLVHNKDIPIKIVAGNFGSGKTLISVRTALHHLLDKGTYSKIFLIRNPIGTGEEIGFVKGDKEQKIAHFLKPIEQNLEGGEFQLKELMMRGQLEFEIPWFIKGQSIANSFILVEEAEDMTVKLIKMIGTRVAEGSCICLSGDWKQSEAKYVRDNGLIHLLNNTKDNPLVGAVVLEADVRSSASKVFAEI